ncbi:MAG: hypothetical protein C4554_09350 [Dethiobacter sp.]|jgi:integrase/recombinase XerD|nr:MAG: hypothetical protein C4554_09350 [Dethiobacter sp.]
MLTEKSLSLEEALDLTLKCAEQSGYGEVTRKGFRGNLFTFMKWCSAQNVSCVGDINTALLKPYFLYLKEKQLSGYTVKSRCNSLRYLFGCLEEKGIIPDNPMNYLKICPRLGEKAWDVLTLEDMGLLLKGVEKRYQDASTEYKRSTLRDKLMLEMLLATGMRSCEIAALKVKDVDLEKGTVRI